jgi:hypothetical protein
MYLLMKTTVRETVLADLFDTELSQHVLQHARAHPTPGLAPSRDHVQETFDSQHG